MSLPAHPPDDLNGPGLGRTVIFLHIPKTGGLTLRHILLKHFPPEATWDPRTSGRQPGDPYLRYIDHGGEDPLRTGQEPDGATRDAVLLAAVPEHERAQLRLVQGHTPFGLHALLSQASTYVTILRDPVERVLSLYHHRVTHHGITLSLAEYVASARDRDLRDRQTRMIAGRVDAGRGDAHALLETAKANLENSFTVVGCTQRYDEMLLLLRRRLGFDRIHYLRQNVGEKRVQRADVPADVLAGIERHNELDRELHGFAGRLMDRAAAEVPDLPRELDAFRRRNARYTFLMSRRALRAPATAALRIRRRVRQASGRLAR